MDLCRGIRILAVLFSVPILIILFAFFTAATRWVDTLLEQPHQTQLYIVRNFTNSEHLKISARRHDWASLSVTTLMGLTCSVNRNKLGFGVCHRSLDL